MRDEFLAIISEWTLIDSVERIGDILEQVADWQGTNPLQPDEQKTVEFIIQTQINKGIARGDFAPYF